jgi:hypothetical protein
MSGQYSCLAEEGDTLDSVAWSAGATRRYSNGSIDEIFQRALLVLNGDTRENPDSAIQYNRGWVKWRRGSEMEKYNLIAGRWLKIPNSVKYYYDRPEQIISQGQRNKQEEMRPVFPSIFDGYVEGGSFNVQIGVGYTGGREVVYNFKTFQRSGFSYNGAAATAGLTLNLSVYTGYIIGFTENPKAPTDFEHFENQYKGTSFFEQGGVGSEAICLSGGVLHFHNADNSIYGNAFYSSGGLCAGIPGVDITGGVSHYDSEPSNQQSYITDCKVDIGKLKSDIMVGIGSPHGPLSVAPRVLASLAAEAAAKDFNAQSYGKPCNC